jgi:hypothetical protein
MYRKAFLGCLFVAEERGTPFFIFWGSILTGCISCLTGRMLLQRFNPAILISNHAGCRA